MKRQRSKSWGTAVAFASALILLFAAANVAVSNWRPTGLHHPDYATWSGVVQVEQKLRLLRDFARQGDVDVLIMSSSLGDTGMSAETLTHELSARYHRPFRVFNFCIGGAEFPTYPLLYRLARLVARPKEIWLAVPVSIPPPLIEPRTLDHQLFKGPLGHYDALPGLLATSYWFHALPLVRAAPALRDMAFHGRFEHRPSTTQDMYRVSAYGDTLTWVHNGDQYAIGEKRRESRPAEVSALVAQDSEPRPDRQPAYFNDRLAAALRELRDEAQRDGARVAVVPFEQSMSFIHKDADFLRASRLYFDALARALGAHVIDARAQFELAPFMVADSIHLNTIGAREFSRVLAAAIAGTPPGHSRSYEVATMIGSLASHEQWTAFSALVPKRRDEPSATLELEYVQSWGLTRLRARDHVQLVLRLPGDRDVVVPAAVVRRGFVVADVSHLALSGHDIVVRAQLAAGGQRDKILLPLAGAKWTDTSYDPALYRPLPLAMVAPEKASFSTLEPIRVRWEGVVAPERGDFVGIYPVDDRGAARRTFAALEGAAWGAAEMRPLFEAGRFELRMFREGGWALVGVSEPFEVVAVTGSLRIGHARAAAGSTLPLHWSAINYPNRKDWIAVFSRRSNRIVHTTYIETDGTPQGDAELRLPKDTPPGDYEVRLYSTGLWRLLATQPLTITAVGG